MAFGTKHRHQQQADACKAHLRHNHSAQGTLVEEFIAEIEGRERDKDQWSKQFSNERWIEAEMLQRVDEAFQKWLNPPA